MNTIFNFDTRQYYVQTENTSIPSVAAPTAAEPELKPRKKKKKPEGKGQKRVANPEQWKRNVIKKNRLSGQEYVSYSGETIPARTMGPDCECPRKCFTDTRRHIFERLFTEFYSMKSKDIQDTYLCGLILAVETKRRYPKKPDSTRASRSSSFQYFIKSPNEFFQVCQKAFCNIHGIKKSRLERIQKAVQQLKVPEDKRGRHTNNPTKVPDETIEMLDQHISAMMGGGKTLPPDMTLKKLLKSYLVVAEAQEQADLIKGVKIKRKIGEDFLRARLKKKFHFSFANLAKSQQKINKQGRS